VNIEGGISAGTRVRWSAVVYRMAVADEIDFDIRSFSYANIGRSRHAGLEPRGRRPLVARRPAVDIVWVLAGRPRRATIGSSRMCLVISSASPPVFTFLGQ